MIIVAGLSPAWQQVYELAELTIGEVNRGLVERRFAAGKAVNVARALAGVDGDFELICPIGGETGDLLRKDFETLGRKVRWIEVGKPTRTCTTVVETGRGRSTELVGPTPPMRPGELAQYLTTFENHVVAASTVVFTGSLPSEAPAHVVKDLMLRSSARFILDVRGAELLEALPLKPYLVKPNRQELSTTLGRPLDDDGDLLEAMRELRERGAQTVMVTSGSGPIHVIDDAGERTFEPPPVKTVDTIGCGDAMTAGLAFQLDADQTLDEAIKFSIACAAENAESPYCCRLDWSSVARRFAVAPDSKPIPKQTRRSPTGSS